MSLRFYSLGLLSSALLIGCQQAGPEVTTEEEVAQDTLTYQIETYTDGLPCKDASASPCLDITIDEINITAGSSESARAKIKSSLDKALADTDNSEVENRHPREIAKNLKAEYRQIVEDMPDYDLSWEYKRQYNVTLNGDGLFAVKLDAYSFTGGAHGASFQYYYTFDSDNGKLLKLSDLIVAKRMGSFKKLAEQQFRDSRDMDSTDTYEDTGFWFENGKFSLSDNFHYSPSGLEIIYNPYEIAPYSEGTIIISFPYNQIQGIIHPEYRLTK